MVVGVTATNIGIDTFQPMYQSVFAEEIKRPIDRRRLRRCITPAWDAYHQVIRLHWLMAFPDERQNLSAQISQSQTGLCTITFSRFQCRLLAMLVVGTDTHVRS